MKLLEYKPHDKWFIWIHPCYLVRTTTDKGGGVMEIVGRYYYGRTHLTMKYFTMEMEDRLKRRGGNFPSIRNTSWMYKYFAGIDPFTPIDPRVSGIPNAVIVHPRKTGKSWIAEYLERGGIEPIEPTFPNIFEDNPNNKGKGIFNIIDFDKPKPKMFYPYSIPTDLIRDIKALLTKYNIFLTAQVGDNILEERKKLESVLKQLNELK